MHFVDIAMFYALEGGGVSTYLNAKARWLGEHSTIRHTILSPSITAASGAGVQAVPGRTFPGLQGYRMPRSVRSCARVLQSLQPDLIEVGDAGQCAWAALRVKRRLQVPVVAFCHSDFARVVGQRFGPLGAQASRSYLLALYRRCDLVLAPSQRMLRQLGELGIADAVCQPLGIDGATFCPQQRDPTLRQRLQLAQHTRLLVYAGRFAPEKNLALLIAAVERLGPPYHLLLVGSGAALPASKRATVLPFEREPRQLARLLASCDALVHPGPCETFGLVVLEAMACGLPVVVTSGGAVGELVDASTGVVVEPNRSEALCDGIEMLFGQDRARMGQCARHKAMAQFDWSRIMPQLLQRYAALLAPRSVRALGREGSCAAD
jgi:alpha-1,6-mannosyltransferase